MSEAHHAAKLPANIQKASDAQARELEEGKVAAAAKPTNPVGHPLKAKPLDTLSAPPSMLKRFAPVIEGD